MYFAKNVPISLLILGSVFSDCVVLYGHYTTWANASDWPLMHRKLGLASSPVKYVWYKQPNLCLLLHNLVGYCEVGKEIAFGCIISK